MNTSTLSSVLPHHAPACPNAKIALFAIRRMGANGLADARAAYALFTAFGEGFRRPLLLVRAMMAEIAAESSMPVAIAPCCCNRVTASEHALLTILARVETATDQARLLMQDMLGHRRADGVLATAAALAAAFADEGRPITA